MKKLLVILIIGLIFSPPLNASTYAISFTDRSYLADLTIAISDRSFLADETWNIKGSCESASTYTRVALTDRSYLADITIALTDRSYLADKDICIKNPRDLPEWFIKILKDL